MSYELTQAELKALYSYDPSTGVFTRAVDHANGLKRGSVAGCLQSARIAYRVIKIRRKLYLCHRLAWLYMTGAFPVGVIDHINGDGLDNRFSNLRGVSNCQNLQATLKTPRHNTSGFKGVYWHKQVGRWVAGISLNNKRKYIGAFDSPEEAHEAYLAVKREVHFS